MAESALEMQTAMKPLLDTGEGADVTLVCRGKTSKVHSSYVWPRSSWFKAACRGGFKEAETQQIELPEEEPSMVYRMLEHSYMQPYTVKLGFDAFWSSNYSWATTRLHVHAQMYSLGDKYDLPGLKMEAARRFEDEVRIPGDSKCKTLTLLSVVQFVYTSTSDLDRGLRNLVARQIFQRFDIASIHFVEELDTALDVRQFARDIIFLHRKRSSIRHTAMKRATIKHVAISREVYRISQSLVQRLLAATMFSLPTAAASSAGMLAAAITLGSLICVFILVLALASITKVHLEMTLEQDHDPRYRWARIK